MIQILSSEEADNYWQSVLTKATVRKRVHAHLTSEAIIADSVLHEAIKRLKSRAPTPEVNFKDVE